MNDDDFDAAVIGSGFGGAVAAARLAQAGLRVVVLERGRRWRPGEFPRDTRGLDGDWVWHKGRGLFDIRWLGSMIGVQAAGWGGGSLVYANVFARPAGRVFDECWPTELSRRALDPYYDLAAHMLEVQPVGRDAATGEPPARTQSMERAVGRMRRTAGTVRPLLAVTFRDTGGEKPVVNRHGVEQLPCAFLGECVIGCNRGSKNSLDQNYLAVALANGAEARVDCEALGIAASDGGYAVSYRDHATGREARLGAKQVFLAAGAVATTELLLRSRDLLASLPGLSPALGSGFSGNGDFLAFVRGAARSVEPRRAPTITTTTIVDCTVGRSKTPVWFQLQDGGYPRTVARLVSNELPFAGVRSRLRGARPEDDRTMTLLMMGRDSSDGRLTLDHHGEAEVAWRDRPNRPLYHAEIRAAHRAAKLLGGRLRLMPSWLYLRTGITVHNLGGAPMGVDPQTSVIGTDGQVHGYPGLYIVDGAAVPAATGVNPSATIAALAERTVEGAIRRTLGDPEWRAPETARVRPAPVPEDPAIEAIGRWREEHAGMPPKESYRTNRPGGRSPRAVSFSETLTGFVTDGDHRLALRVDLDVHVPDGDHAGRPATAAVTGTATLGRSTSPVRGTVTLFPSSGVNMRYELRAAEGAGAIRSMVGVKDSTRSVGRLAHDLTTLRVELVGSDDAVRHGQLRIGPARVVALMLSLRPRGGTASGRPATMARFIRSFAASALRNAIPAAH